MPSMVRAVVSLGFSILRSFAAFLRTREEQAIVEFALRQQLAVYAQRQPRPRISPLDRAFWVALSRLWPRWRNVFVIVQPDTVVRWQKRRFRVYWRSISTPGPGSPPISKEIQALILRMATENRRRAWKIHSALSKLGIHLGLSTISRYLPRRLQIRAANSAGARTLRDRRRPRRSGCRIPSLTRRQTRCAATRRWSPSSIQLAQRSLRNVREARNQRAGACG